MSEVRLLPMGIRFLKYGETMFVAKKKMFIAIIKRILKYFL